MYSPGGIARSHWRKPRAALSTSTRHIFFRWWLSLHLSVTSLLSSKSTHILKVNECSSGWSGLSHCWGLTPGEATWLLVSRYSLSSTEKTWASCKNKAVTVDLTLVKPQSITKVSRWCSRHFPTDPIDPTQKGWRLEGCIRHSLCPQGAWNMLKIHKITQLQKPTDNQNHCSGKSQDRENPDVTKGQENRKHIICCIYVAMIYIH